MAKGDDKGKVEFLYATISKEVKDLLDQYNAEQKIELIRHLTLLFDEIPQYFKARNPSALQPFTNREVAMLENYRSAYKPYADVHFFDLFDTDKLLLTKGYYTPEEFNALPKEVTALNQQEVLEFCNAMGDLLSDLEYNALLQTDNNTPMSTTSEEESTHTEMQQLLAIHYLLKAGFNAEARGSNSVSQVTQLAHLLMGKKFTTLQNSNIYKKYKKLPNFDSPAQLVKDLKHIRPYFELMELKSVVELINKDLHEAEADKKRDKK